MMKKSWKQLEGKFHDRQNKLSNEKCACGCGQFISVRAAKAKAKGKTDGYVKGHTWKGKQMPDSAKEKMRENHAEFSGSNNPNWQGGRDRNKSEFHTAYARQFKEAIRKRDGSCVLCHQEAIDVHHIEPYLLAEDLRLDEKNCVLLCDQCHARADNKHHQKNIKPLLQNYIKELYKETETLLDFPQFSKGYTKRINYQSIAQIDLLFRKQIKARDGECVLCGNKTKLECHHIESCDEKEFDENNAVTLCKSCRLRIHENKKKIKPMLQAYIESIFRSNT